MYVGVDIGGTKTLVTALDDKGVIVEQDRFPTPKKYDEFLDQLSTSLSHFKHHDFRAGAVGIPAVTIDRKHGIGINYSNLPWLNTPVQADLERLCSCPMVVENDTKLAGFSEAQLLKNEFSTVLYVTISTGIGYALIVDGVIDTNVGDGGGRTIMLDHKGKLMPWEDFASGRAIAERYGKKAEDITEHATWQIISRDLAKGFVHLIAIMQPQVIVIGGAVGTFFDHYHQSLVDEIKKYEIPLGQLLIRQAQRPEEAVIFGCYDLAKQVYGS